MEISVMLYFVCVINRLKVYNDEKTLAKSVLSFDIGCMHSWVMWPCLSIPTPVEIVPTCNSSLIDCFFSISSSLHLFDYSRLLLWKNLMVSFFQGLMLKNLHDFRDVFYLWNEYIWENFYEFLSWEFLRIKFKQNVLVCSDLMQWKNVSPNAAS